MQIDRQTDRQTKCFVPFWVIEGNMIVVGGTGFGVSVRKFASDSGPFVPLYVAHIITEFALS